MDRLTRTAAVLRLVPAEGTEAWPATPDYCPTCWCRIPAGVECCTECDRIALDVWGAR